MAKNQPDESGGARDPDPEALLRARARQLEQMRQVRETSTFEADQREAYDELSVVDQHPADIGTETFDREMDRSVLDMVEREAELVRRALERQADGKYGICSRCGRQIDPERLVARPEAIYCVDCQRLVDAGRA